MRFLAVVALLAVGCGSIDEEGPTRGNVSGSCPHAELREGLPAGSDYYYFQACGDGTSLLAICGVADVTTKTMKSQDIGCDIINVADQSFSCVAKCP